MIFGLWHNGWCGFRTTRNPDRLGYGYSGTEEEARAGQAQFVQEGMPASEYEVAPFNPMREPAVRPGKPTLTQLEELKHIDRTVRESPGVLRVTLKSLFDHGWICLDITTGGQPSSGYGMRLTRAGRAFLSQPKEKVR